MAGEGESPLAGVAYDAERGEFGLLRFVPSATHDQIHAFLATYTPDMQAALTEADFYTIFLAETASDADAARLAATAEG